MFTMSLPRSEVILGLEFYKHSAPTEPVKPGRLDRASPTALRCGKPPKRNPKSEIPNPKSKGLRSSDSQQVSLLRSS